MFALAHAILQMASRTHPRHNVITAKQTDVPPEFISATFVVHTTSNKLAGMIFDQYHEQNNANVKGSGNQGHSDGGW